MAAKKRAKSSKSRKAPSCEKLLWREEGALLSLRSSLNDKLAAWKMAKDAGDARDAAYWKQRLRDTVDKIEEQKVRVAEFARNCR